MPVRALAEAASLADLPWDGLHVDESAVYVEIENSAHITEGSLPWWGRPKPLARVFILVTLRLSFFGCNGL